MELYRRSATTAAISTAFTSHALTTPSHAYPHTAAFGYVQLLLEAFGAERCAKLTLEP